MLKKLLFFIFPKSEFTSRHIERNLAEIETCLRNVLCDRICLLVANAVKHCLSSDNKEGLREAKEDLNRAIERYVRAVRICDKSAAGEEISMDEIVRLKV